MSQLIKQTNNIKVYCEDGLQTIVMNRPNKRNAISCAMMDDISCSLKEAELNDNVVFVVLTGTDNFYSSGYDFNLDGNFQLNYDEFIDRQIEVGKNFVATLIDFKKILIAVVNGPAIGIATTTLALCDIVYAVNKATFSTPFIELGISSEGCSSFLFVELMGSAKDGSMLYTGKILTAKQAYECNLVSDVFHSTDDIFSAIRSKMPNLMAYKETVMANKKLRRTFRSEMLHKVNHIEWEELRRRFKTEEFLNVAINFKQRRHKRTSKL